MIKKVFITVVLGFLLQGCTDNSLDKARQDYACRESGGVYSYAETVIGNLTCVNGYKPDFKEYKGTVIPEEYYPDVKH